MDILNYGGFTDDLFDTMNDACKVDMALTLYKSNGYQITKYILPRNGSIKGTFHTLLSKVVTYLKKYFETDIFSDHKKVMDTIFNSIGDT